MIFPSQKLEEVVDQSRGSEFHILMHHAQFRSYKVMKDDVERIEHAHITKSQGY